jgi:hypothetical protein
MLERHWEKIQTVIGRPLKTKQPLPSEDSEPDCDHESEAGDDQDVFSEYNDLVPQAVDARRCLIAELAGVANDTAGLSREENSHFNVLSPEIATVIATVSAEATTERALADALGAVRKLWQEQALSLRMHEHENVAAAAAGGSTNSSAVTSASDIASGAASGQKPRSITMSTLLDEGRTRSLQSQVEDSSVVISSILRSPRVVPMLAEVTAWQKWLESLRSLLSVWLSFQQTWLDVTKMLALPELGQLLGRKSAIVWERVDGWWRTLMAAAAAVPEVRAMLPLPKRGGGSGYSAAATTAGIDAGSAAATGSAAAAGGAAATGGDGAAPTVERKAAGGTHEAVMIVQLRREAAALEEINLALLRFCEAKVALFPRFFFLSQPQLLRLLHDSCDVSSIQQHLHLCFGAVGHIEFENPVHSGTSKDSSIAAAAAASIAAKKWEAKSHTGSMNIIAIYSSDGGHSGGGIGNPGGKTGRRHFGSAKLAKNLWGDGDAERIYVGDTYSPSFGVVSAPLKARNGYPERWLPLLERRLRLVLEHKLHDVLASGKSPEELVVAGSDGGGSADRFPAQMMLLAQRLLWCHSVERALRHVVTIGVIDAAVTGVTKALDGCLAECHVHLRSMQHCLRRLQFGGKAAERRGPASRETPIRAHMAAAAKMAAAARGFSRAGGGKDGGRGGGVGINGGKKPVWEACALSAMLQVAIEQRDVVEELKEHGVCGVDSFGWQMRQRYYYYLPVEDIAESTKKKSVSGQWTREHGPAPPSPASVPLTDANKIALTDANKMAKSVSAMGWQRRASGLHRKLKGLRKGMQSEAGQRDADAKVSRDDHSGLGPCVLRQGAMVAAYRFEYHGGPAGMGVGPSIHISGGGSAGGVESDTGAASSVAPVACGRLVTTPLTERCMHAMMTALHQFDGAMLIGPSGVGKSTMAQELSRLLGRAYLPVHCAGFTRAIANHR